MRRVLRKEVIHRYHSTIDLGQVNKNSFFERGMESFVCGSQVHFFNTENTNSVILEPGFFNIDWHHGDAILNQIEIQKKVLLENIKNTDLILKEANKFFSKLKVYEQLGKKARRGILLHSKPGLGKTSTISAFCNKLFETNDDTAVLVWPTSSIEPWQVEVLFQNLEYSDSVKKIVLIIEDIGGGEIDAEITKSADSSLLNFLDGVICPFKRPTLILATTNHPENLLEQLVDRPGRFDFVLELKYPSADERMELINFFKRDLFTISKEDEDYLRSELCNDLSIAHLEESVLRTLMNETSLKISLEELVKHKAKVKSSFSDKKERVMGLGSIRDDDL